MAKEEVIVGIDVGSSRVRAVVGGLKASEEKVQIIGVGEARSEGIRRGVIVDVEEAVNSISEALDKVERTGGVPVESAVVAVSGSHVVAQNSRGVIAVSRADNEITEDDVSRVIESASAVSLPANQEILHVIPQSFSVDNQKGIKDPVGMSGIRLEVETSIIEGSSSFVKNLTKCLNRAGVEIEDLVVSPLAASRAVLSKKQKELGVAIVDVGGGTTGMAAFEEGDLLGAAILPVGSERITKDVAIGLRTTVEAAEKIKREFGSAYPKEINKEDQIDLSAVEGAEDGVIPRRHVAEIIEARFSEIFSLVDKELKKLDRSGKLPGGVILVGGGVKLPGVVDLAREELRLPVQVGFPESLPGLAEKLEDPAFAVAEGLVLWGFERRLSGEKGFTGGLAVNETVGKIKKWFKNFLP